MQHVTAVSVENEEESQEVAILAFFRVKNTKEEKSLNKTDGFIGVVFSLNQRLQLNPMNYPFEMKSVE